MAVSRVVNRIHRVGFGRPTGRLLFVGDFFDEPNSGVAFGGGVGEGGEGKSGMEQAGWQ